MWTQLIFREREWEASEVSVWGPEINKKSQEKLIFSCCHNGRQCQWVGWSIQRLVWGWPWFPATCLTGQTQIVGSLSYLHQETAVTVQSVPHVVKLRPCHHLPASLSQHHHQQHQHQLLLLVQPHILDNCLPFWGGLRCLWLCLNIYCKEKNDIMM